MAKHYVFLQVLVHITVVRVVVLVAVHVVVEVRLVLLAITNIDICTIMTIRWEAIIIIIDVVAVKIIIISRNICTTDQPVDHNHNKR